jgi:hypothetical protein
MKLEPEMTYIETIDGPWGPTAGSPYGTRLCWQVWSARLTGPRIDARLAMPGHDWVRVGPDGIRRQDLRATMITADGAVIMVRYDVALIRESPRFLAALTSGESTDYDDQYMRIAPVFDTGAAGYAWLTESLFIGEGRIAGARQIEYSIYRVE